MTCFFLYEYEKANMVKTLKEMKDLRCYYRYWFFVFSFMNLEKLKMNCNQAVLIQINGVES